MDTLAAAHLRTDDRQADNANRRRRWPALALLFASVPTPAWAAPWLACSAPGLSPPVAVAQVAPPYPESARQAGAEGFVDVAFTVLRDGQVGWTRILRAEPSGFFESTALGGVRDWRYEPARARGGEPIECRIQTRVRFTLADTVAARPAGAPPPGQGDQPAPIYPEQARIDGLEGYVEVAFEVDGNGRVRDAEVTLAMPRGEFERAALAAVRQWRFPAQVGAPRRLNRRFEFTLPGGLPREPAATLFAAAPLPAEACASRIAGRVLLEVKTDTDGRVTEARILDADPPGLFDATALAVARNSRMAPAYRGGMPIVATALLTLRFEPDAARCPGPDADDPRNPRQRSGPGTKVSAVTAQQE